MDPSYNAAMRAAGSVQCNGYFTMQSLNIRDSQNYEVQEPSGDQLETAHQRMLTYLKALHIPVRLRCSLAARALAQAEADLTADGDFVAAAMRNLEKGIMGCCAAGFHDELAGLQPMPPLNRGAMIPVTIDRSGPITFFFTLLANAVKPLLHPPVRLYFLLLLFGATAGFYWWLDMA